MYILIYCLLHAPYWGWVCNLCKAPYHPDPWPGMNWWPLGAYDEAQPTVLHWPDIFRDLLYKYLVYIIAGVARFWEFSYFIILYLSIHSVWPRGLQGFWTASRFSHEHLPMTTACRVTINTSGFFFLMSASPPGSPPNSLLDKSPPTQQEMFEMTRNHKIFYSEGMCPGPTALSAWDCHDRPAWPLKAWLVSPAGLRGNNLFYFNFLWTTVQYPTPHTSCSI